MQRKGSSHSLNGEPRSLSDDELRPRRAAGRPPGSSGRGGGLLLRMGPSTLPREARVIMPFALAMSRTLRAHAVTRAVCRFGNARVPKAEVLQPQPRIFSHQMSSTGAVARTPRRFQRTLTTTVVGGISVLDTHGRFSHSQVVQTL
jgi:hypothetical protein